MSDIAQRPDLVTAYFNPTFQLPFFQNRVREEKFCRIGNFITYRKLTNDPRSSSSKINHLNELIVVSPTSLSGNDHSKSEAVSAAKVLEWIDTSIKRDKNQTNEVT